MYGSTAAHCVYFVGCMAAWLCVQRQERKIGGGEWLHQESRRRVERREGGQFPFCNTHATWTHRESGERKENNKREKEREKETLQPRRPSVRLSVLRLVGWLYCFCFFGGREEAVFSLSADLRTNMGRESSWGGLTFSEPLLCGKSLWLTGRKKGDGEDMLRVFFHLEVAVGYWCCALKKHTALLEWG